MAASSTRGMIQINLGLFPGWGGMRRLAQLVGPSLAQEWCLTAKQLSADQANAQGLAME